jgi:hypothetical protein
MGKYIKEVKGNKSTSYCDIPGDVLKLLGEASLQITTRVLNKRDEEDKCPTEFKDVRMTA